MRTIETTQTTVRLEVNGRDGWGRVNELVEHWSLESDMITRMREIRQRWIACDHFGLAKLRIRVVRPDGGEVVL